MKLNPRSSSVALFVVATLALLSSVASDRAFGENAMELNSTVADPGATGVPMTVSMSNDDPVDGYSIALTFDPIIFQCEGAVEVGGFEPEFFSTSIDNATGNVVLGAILALEPTEPTELPISPVTRVEMVEFAFTVRPQTLQGDYTIEFSNGVGDPPIDNLYSIDGFDTAVDVFVDGTVTVGPATAISFLDPPAFVGFPLPVDVLADTLFPLQSVNVEVEYDTAVLTLDTLDLSPMENTLLIQSGESNIEFLETETDAFLGRVEVAALFDFLPPFDPDKAIPSGTTRILRLNFDVDPTIEIDDETELCFTENAGGNLFTYLDGLVAVIPENECLTATFTELVDQPFTRGDVDGNGVVFPLGDVVYLLDWFFTGGIEPPCLKAADVDDDGNLFGLLDAIYLLEWGFTNGPLPPDPGPLDCGFDPTPDTIFCFTAGCTP